MKKPQGAIYALSAVVLSLGGLVQPVAGDGISVGSGSTGATLCTAAGAMCSVFAGSGESVVATYTDSNTQDSAYLADSDGNLVCGWHAENAPHNAVDFVPTYYGTFCKVTGVSSGGSASCASQNGAASGECTLVNNFNFGENVKWTVATTGHDIRVTTESSTKTTRDTVTKWEVHGDCDGGIKLGVEFAGDVPLPSAEVSESCGEGASYEMTSETIISKNDYVKVTERHALLVSTENRYVDLVPRVENVDWSGNAWGCDELDAVEALFGPDEIGSYSIHYKADGTTDGKLVTNYESSLAWGPNGGVTDQGAFSRIIGTVHGFTAGYELAGTTSIDTNIHFKVKYEYPEGAAGVTWLGNIIHLETQSGAKYSLTSSLTQLAGVVYVTRVSTDAPLSALGPVTAPVSKATWEAARGDVGLATALTLLGGLDPVVSARLASTTPAAAGDHPCSAFDPAEPLDPQQWTATATAQGLSTSAAGYQALPVDVYLALGAGSVT